MNTKTEITTKRHSQKDEDEAYRLLAQQVREEYREERTDDMNEAAVVLDKIEEVQRNLVQHMGKRLDASPWVFQGFDITPNPNAVALWPITAKLLFTHTKTVGYESARAWGESGSDIAFAWLKAIDFPITDIEFIMNQPIND